MRKADIVSGALLLGFGVLALLVIIPAEISGHSAYGLPPDFFPRVLAWLITLLAAALLLSRLLGRHDASPVPMSGADFAFIAGTSVLLAVTFLVMDRWGFIPAAALAILAAGAAMGELRHPLRLVLLAALAPVAIFQIFRHGFLVFLPG